MSDANSELRHRAIRSFAYADPQLIPAERETTIRFARDQNEASIYTAEQGIGRRLLAHPEATIRFLNVLQNGQRDTRILDEVREADQVVGVAADVPVGLLKIQQRTRKSTAHAEIVTEQVLEDIQQ